MAARASAVPSVGGYGVGARAVPDPGAFDLLYHEHGRVLRGYLRKALPDPSEAEDLAQTALANAFEALGSGKRPRDVRAWLFGIARNELLTHISRRRRVVVVDAPELTALCEAEGAFDPSELGWLTEPRLISVIGRLPVLQQRVLVLSFVFDFNAAEAAALLGTTPGMVRKAKCAAMKTLRDSLSGDRGTGSWALFACSRLPARRRGRASGGFSTLPRLGPQLLSRRPAAQRF